MTCPTCARPLPAGQSRCAACAAAAVPVEGALAPDLSRRTPRASVEPIREVPGKRRRERTWKDEVRERVDRRREVRVAPPAETRADAALPLFPEGSNPPPLRAAPARSPAQARRAERRLSNPAPPQAPAPGSGPSVLDAPESAAAPVELRLLEDAAPSLELDSLELRPTAAADPRALLDEGPDVFEGEETAASSSAPRDVVRLSPREVAPPRFGERASARPAPALTLAEAPEDDWTLDPPQTAAEARPLERPAGALERLQAALVDLGLLVGLAAVVVYFAARVAQVPLAGLRPAWPMLTAYLMFLALAYASYFTGTTGQTIGKILLGLRVVDSGGQAPGYGRAALRALLGSAGTLLAGAGLATILFDPARRAFHDRLVRTRVVSANRAAQ